MPTASATQVATTMTTVYTAFPRNFTRNHLREATLRWVHDPTTTWVLTGAIGTGKSTVGSMLAARGARVIDADRIGHAVIDASGPAFAAVAQRWPEAVVGGHIDRQASRRDRIRRCR